MARRFFIWLSVLMGVWAFANWPRSGGTLKSWLYHAGFPWTFACWNRGNLEWFDAAALAADLAVLAALIPLAWCCAWSRRNSPPATDLPSLTTLPASSAPAERSR